MGTRALLLVASAVIAILIAALLDPVAQDPDYHVFADRRAWLGIPNAANVLSNLPFAVVGWIGLRRARRARSGLGLRVLYAGVLATAFGSAFYHLAPANGPLVADRLPMSVSFAALLAVLVGERLSARAGALLLWPLVLAATASVAWWAYTEAHGRGDLRAYGVTQFYPGLAAAVLLWPPALTDRVERAVWPALAWYVLAKLAEAADGPLYALGGVVSGHTLKHLLAAAGTACLLRLTQAEPRTPGAGAAGAAPRPA